MVRLGGVADLEHVDFQDIVESVFGTGSTLRKGVFLLEDVIVAGRGAEAAILGYSFSKRYWEWPEALGASVTLDGKLYTVVGITRPAFGCAIPSRICRRRWGRSAKFLQSRGPHPAVGAVARLKPGATLAQAQDELTLIGRHLAEPA